MPELETTYSAERPLPRCCFIAIVTMRGIYGLVRWGSEIRHI